jgi:hypothetical protein
MISLLFYILTSNNNNSIVCKNFLLYPNLNNSRKIRVIYYDFFRQIFALCLVERWTGFGGMPSSAAKPPKAVQRPTGPELTEKTSWKVTILRY